MLTPLKYRQNVETVPTSTPNFCGIYQMLRNLEKLIMLICINDTSSSVNYGNLLVFVNGSTIVYSFT